MSAAGSSAWRMQVFFAARDACIATNSTKMLVLPCVKCLAWSKTVHRIAAFASEVWADRLEKAVHKVCVALDVIHPLAGVRQGGGFELGGLDFCGGC
eukprot:5112278-Ditylum_brightwellii.AAC.1